MSLPLALHDVFGIRREVHEASYVDRGGLDRQLRALLERDQHVVIHGDTKQGKSWLRRRHLDDERSVTLQCLSTHTPEHLLEDALAQIGVRAVLKRSEGGMLEGQLQIEGLGEGAGPFLEAGGRDAATVEAARERVAEAIGFGQRPGSLGSVARALLADGRRIVIEDFHYFPQRDRSVMASWIKSLWEMGLFLIVVGAWSEANFLTIYNGDLDGRISDVEVRWTEPELESVLVRGCEALNIEMGAELRSELVAAAFGNVGLLQRLAAGLCEREGISQWQHDRRTLSSTDSFEQTARAVAAEMRSRYSGFASKLCEGGAGVGAPAYGLILQALFSFGDAALIEGVPKQELTERLEQDFPGRLTASSLNSALRRLEATQERLGIRPIVLGFGAEQRRVRLTDPAMLFSRRFGALVWPWELPETDPLF